MQSRTITLKGISPLLMHAFPMTPIEAIEKKSPEEQARLSEYRSPDGMLFIPGVAIQRTLVNAATYSKGKGRGSLVKIAAACLMVTPEINIIDPQKYVVDARPIVNPTTRGRTMRFRPRFDSWQVSFRLDWDENLMTEAQVRRIVDDGGSRVGLLDFRPACKGPFGRFMVTEWKE